MGVVFVYQSQWPHSCVTKNKRLIWQHARNLIIYVSKLIKILPHVARDFLGSLLTKLCTPFPCILNTMMTHVKKYIKRQIDDWVQNFFVRSYETHRIGRITYCRQYQMLRFPENRSLWHFCSNILRLFDGCSCNTIALFC